MNDISTQLLHWYDANQAQLPWRGSRDPYPIWVSEVMAQQTQLQTVIPYYQRWMERFPTVAALANSSLDEVLKLWEGLGYYSRARNMHASAQLVATEMNGEMPATVEGLLTLKGIGKYTAGAIASICFDIPAPALDGNGIRILTRLFDIEEDITHAKSVKRLWELAADLMPASRPGDYNQALMELGQYICLPKQPKCDDCPLNDLCVAAQRGSQLQRPVKPPRPKTPHYNVVAGIIWREGAPNVGGRFLIAQRPLDGLLGGLWEFPGGKVENGESHQSALKREIREELNLNIETLDHQSTVKHAFTHFRITLYAYHAAWLNGEITHLGVADHRWVNLDELTAFAFGRADQQIIDSLQNSFRE